MNKVEFGAKVTLYPLPITLVGANVRGKPNYLAVAYCGAVGKKPPALSVTLRKSHYTTSGVIENGSFSVNIPSAKMAQITDYCGIASGHKVDKSRLFGTFYGKLGTAPMIEECPVNIECKLVETVDLTGGTATIFIGEIAATYIREECLTDGLPDIKKINPIIFSTNDFNYWTLGEHLAKAFSVGKDFKQASEE